MISNRIILLARYAWPSPYTLFGVMFLVAPWSGGRHYVRYRGTIGIVGPAIQKLLRWAPIDGGAAAITFGHTILAVSAEAFMETWEHEAVHVRQYERWGPFFVPAYLLCGWWELVHGRDPYWDNTFEREARSRS